MDLEKLIDIAMAVKPSDGSASEKIENFLHGGMVKAMLNGELSSEPSDAVAAVGSLLSLTLAGYFVTTNLDAETRKTLLTETFDAIGASVEQRLTSKHAVALHKRMAEFAGFDPILKEKTEKPVSDLPYIDHHGTAMPVITSDPNMLVQLKLRDGTELDPVTAQVASYLRWPWAVQNKPDDIVGYRKVKA